MIRKHLRGHVRDLGPTIGDESLGPLFDRAWVRLHRGNAPSVEQIVIERTLHRPRSTSAQVAVVGVDGSRRHMWLKIDLTSGPEASADGAVPWRRSVERQVTYGHRIEAALQPFDIRVPELLAHDEDRWATVHTFASGRRLGTLAVHARSPSQWRALCQQMYRIGHGVRAMESLASGAGPFPPRATPPGLERGLAVVGARLGKREEELARSLLGRHATEFRTVATVITHGDLSPTNILRSGHGPQASLTLVDWGLIDALPGAELARLQARLEFDRPRIRRLVDDATASLVEGYGDPTIATKLGWKERQVRMMVRVLSRLGPTRTGVGRIPRSRDRGLALQILRRNLRP